MGNLQLYEAFGNEIKTLSKQKVFQKPPKDVKPEISELFESNPELANAVYEALGIRDYKGITVELGRSKVIEIGKVQNIIVKYNGEAITGENRVSGLGEMHVVIQSKDAFVAMIRIPLNFQGKGLAKYIYQATADLLNTPIINSKKRDQDQTESGGYVWKNRTSFEPNQITPQQKQQAQQLYSQYLEETGKQDIEGFKKFAENRLKEMSTESNPKLANAVYEALGFNNLRKEYSNIIIDQVWKRLSSEGITNADFLIGTRDTINNKDFNKFWSAVKDVDIQNVINFFKSEKQKALNSFDKYKGEFDPTTGTFTSNDTSFFDKKIKDLETLLQQKQQAQQLYSQYLEETGKQDIEGFKKFAENRLKEMSTGAGATIGFQTGTGYQHQGKKKIHTMENLQLYEAFGKGSANAVNPLFKKNFIDMATNAFGYTMRADKLTKDVDGVKCTIEVKDNGIKCDLIGDYPLTKTKAMDYVKFLLKADDKARKTKK